MKVNLIVTAAGPNQGRAIPIIGAKFSIGRDPSCNLRPASQAISKLHCAVLINDGEVHIEDYGSTNGTVLNGEAIQGKRQLVHGDALKIGPLEFKLEIVRLPAPSDGTPLPESLKQKIPADASGVLVGASAGAKSATTTVAPPKEPIRSKPQTEPKSPSTETVALSNSGSETFSGQDADDAAALLLSLDDDSPTGEATDSQVPDGSTIMELPAVDAAGRLIPPKKKEVELESSTVASDLLKKYFRRTS